jgi:predicted site-specific integrase-resolvase
VTDGVLKMLFPIERAAALAGITAPLARRWIRSGLVRIEHADVGLLTFRDLVALRTLAILRAEHGRSRV